MASGDPEPDLSAMYPIRRTDGWVHEPAPAYGSWPDGDRYPADDVLEDLAAVGHGDAALRTARILARYAALREWLLRLHGAVPALTRHAATAARAHLDMAGSPTGEAWEEGVLLRRLGSAGPAEAPGLLALAATEAARAGATAGAAALRGAAREASLTLLRSRRRPGE